MAQSLGYEMDQGVALITIDNPPVNALTHAVRRQLMGLIDRAEEDDQVTAIVLMGQGATFPAGGDLAELDQAPQDPALRDLCERVEFCDKPVVAALHGTVYGGGFELALACHYRLAMPGTRASLPEIMMGLPPSAGATQRLPRLAGAKLALDMMLTGGMVRLDRPPGQSLVDGQGAGQIRAAVLQFCATLRDRGLGARRLSDRRDAFADMSAYQDDIAHRRKTITDPQSARGQVLHLVESAPLLPFSVGLAMEQDAFEQAFQSEAAAALRHSFKAERAARRFPARPKKLPDIRTISVLGPGALASQIVVAALQSGLSVQWGAREADRLNEGVSQVREIFSRQKSKDAGPLALKTGESADMVAGADMILHATRGQGDVPAPREMVRAVAMPARVDALGLRFAPPVFTNRLVEVIQGPECTDMQLAFGVALGEKLGKVPVHVRSTGDSVAGRLTAALQQAADALIDMGHDPFLVDQAVEEWGWHRPPFRHRDLMGLTDLANQPRGRGARNWSADLVGAGRKGWIGGKGFYDWGDDGPQPSAVVSRLLSGLRPALDLDPNTVVPLLVGAMANAGAVMLRQGMVARASDIDVVAMLVMDFPRGRGGPMKAASLQGLFSLMKQIERFGHPDDAFWTLDPIWAELVKNGKDFDDT